MKRQISDMALESSESCTGDEISSSNGDIALSGCSGSGRTDPAEVSIIVRERPDRAVSATRRIRSGFVLCRAVANCGSSNSDIASAR